MFPGRLFLARLSYTPARMPDIRFQWRLHTPTRNVRMFPDPRCPNQDCRDDTEELHTGHGTYRYYWVNNNDLGPLLPCSLLDQGVALGRHPPLCSSHHVRCTLCSRRGWSRSSRPPGSTPRWSSRGRSPGSHNLPKI
jgi:hypothetical protein